MQQSQFAFGYWTNLFSILSLIGGLVFTFSVLTVKLDNIEKRLDRFETKVNDRFNKFETKVDEKFNRMDQKLLDILVELRYHEKKIIDLELKSEKVRK